MQICDVVAGCLGVAGFLVSPVVVGMINASRVRVVSFDLDGTLIDKNFDDLLWFYEIPRLLAEERNIGFEEARRYVSAEYDLVGDGDMRWYDVAYWFKHFGLKTDYEEVINNLSDKIRLFPESMEVIEGLSRKYELVIISNANRLFLQLKLKACDLEKYFSRIFSVTSDFGQVKKLPEVYGRVLEILGCEPVAMVHVGDHWNFDYVIPRSLGIQAIYLDREKKLGGKPGVIHNLEELRDMLLTPEHGKPKGGKQCFNPGNRVKNGW
ncbi:MAG: HAD family hydrolase [Methanobacteriota archaeon]|nr:MAG: HAD family hydrolase [Euryarchaeota archaeon]